MLEGFDQQYMMEVCFSLQEISGDHMSHTEQRSYKCFGFY